MSFFEAAARHQSFTKAAEELCVTQSAICRQIAALEDFLDVKLFRRSRRGVVLTEAGINYGRKVAARLDDVERDTLELMAKGGNGATLELGVVPTFATKWLLRRLPSFNRDYPDITLNLTARTRPFLFDESPFDAAIYAGDSVWPGTESVFLIEENLVPVCSPSYIQAGRKRSQPDWQRMTLLQQSTRPYSWRDWFTASTLKIDGDMTGPRFELFSMLAEAAVQGMGAALIPRFLIEEELARGVLQQLSNREYLSGRSYYLIYPQQGIENSALMTFRRWLEQQAKEYRASIAVAA